MEERVALRSVERVHRPEPVDAGRLSLIEGLVLENRRLKERSAQLLREVLRLRSELQECE